jgi:PBSX family phage portal protein
MTADNLFTAEDDTLQDTGTGKAMVFAFGDPEPVLTSNVTDYLGVFMDVGGDYYRPPVDLTGLANLMSANAYHGPILHFKKNMLAKWFTPSLMLSSLDFKRAALDYVVTGNAYLQCFKNRLGQVVRLGWLPALSMRPHKKAGVFVKLNSSQGVFSGMNYTEFKAGEVVHLKEPDIKQSIYGMPQYLGGIQSVLLSEDASLFRRKYFINGAHMGYILVTADANLDEATAKAIENQVKQSKGPGNFRSLYLNIPRANGNKEPVKIIPVGNIGSKDEFQAIKEVTEMEMLAMHRVYPGLAAIIPANVGGFGDMQKAMQVYHELEVTAMQQVFLELNEVIPGNPVAFNDPVWQS